MGPDEHPLPGTMDEPALREPAEDRPPPVDDPTQIRGVPRERTAFEKGLAEGVAEVKTRKTGEKIKLPPSDIPATLLRLASSARSAQ